ncbi:hypothetical protein DFH11DRAFT_1855309 [Phellopilus nigrolimitatus]|nr:hypothetical protein DFH11DRAFT_1855309 [Phellopilus nigrolimitatus]
MSRDGKPLELPGLYWDEERRRYFPMSSRPKRKTEDDLPSAKNDGDETTGRRQMLKFSTVASIYTKGLRSGLDNFSNRSRIVHEITGKVLSDTYSELDPPIRPLSWESTMITSLHAAVVSDGTLNVLIGDSEGYFYCSRAHPKPCPDSTPTSEPDRFNGNSRLFMSYHLGTVNAVSSIVRSGYTAVAVSRNFDTSQFCVRDLKAPDLAGFNFPRLNVAGDVWAAGLLDRTLSLGLTRKLVIVKDIGHVPIKEYTTFRTKSDVLSLFQLPNTVTIGSRNGEVRLFDIRMREDAGSELLGDRFSAEGNPAAKVGTKAKKAGAHSAITHLQGVREWELLVGTSAGELELFDRRFFSGTRSQPTIIFPGHVNSYVLDLGITTDPSQDFVFAAGQDRRVRGWSLRTGRPLGALFGGAPLQSTPRALQVTETGAGERRLWVAQKEEVRVFHLGVCGKS